MITIAYFGFQDLLIPLGSALALVVIIVLVIIRVSRSGGSK